MIDNQDGLSYLFKSQQFEPTMAGCWGGIKSLFKDAVEAAQVVQEDGGKVTQAIADVLNSPSSVSLNDKELVFLLALAANDSYSLSGECRGRLKLLDGQPQNSRGCNMDNIIQFGVYEIVDGKHN